MTATAEAPQLTAAPKPPLLGKKERKALLDPMWDNNPIAIQILGICSALAVTTKLGPTLVMGCAVVFVLGVSNVVISLMRSVIPSRIRIIVQLVVIAGVVTIVDLLLQRFVFGLSKQLSVFVSLIVTNCIVMGRAEAFAMANGPWRSFLDGVGNGIGYAWVILAVAFFRELLGSGSLFGVPVVPASWYVDAAHDTGFFVNNGLMVLAPGAFLVLGIIVWVQRAISGYSESH